MEANASQQSVVAATPSAAICLPLPPLYPPALPPRAIRPPPTPLDPALNPAESASRARPWRPGRP
eukprot:164002-Chlamydomonas_euryale.AAC.1